MRRTFSIVVAGLAPLLAVACNGSTEPESLCAAQTQIAESECDALVTLYEQTNGPGWQRASGWLETEMPCEWEGVSCEAGSVVELELGDNGLSGTVPPELAKLTMLRDLGLPSNDLGGEIPPELGSLEHLVFLYLFSCDLTGSIPPELANLTSLRMLFLRNNELTGTIPPELGSMPSLQRLVLSSNHLTGSVPAELGALDGLDTFWIYGNDLEGALPLSVAQMGAAIQQAYNSFDCDMLPGNDGLFIPDSDEYRAADLDGDGFICELSVPVGGAVER